MGSSSLQRLIPVADALYMKIERDGEFLKGKAEMNIPLGGLGAGIVGDLTIKSAVEMNDGSTCLLLRGPGDVVLFVEFFNFGKKLWVFVCDGALLPERLTDLFESSGVRDNVAAEKMIKDSIVAAFEQKSDKKGWRRRKLKKGDGKVKVEQHTTVT